MWANIITAIILGTALFYAYRQWRSTQNARMADIILDITARWDSEEMERSRNTVCKSTNLKQEIENASQENSIDLYDLIRVGNFFDSLGALTAEGYLDCKLCYQLFGAAEERYYQRYKPLIDDTQHGNKFKYFTKLHLVFAKQYLQNTERDPNKQSPVQDCKA
jgi:hypothetical protein